MNTPHAEPAAYPRVQDRLGKHPRTWLVTGAAGFIGSNLVEALLRLGQTVIGLDNFATGRPQNLEDLRRETGRQSRGFTFLEGDIRDREVCRRVCCGIDFVLHQAALGSVPRSLEDPATTNAVNVDGFLNMLLAARDAEVKRFVYASSSSVYGDHPALPKEEEQVGAPLSPYAVTKRTGEFYAGTFAQNYGLETVGLRNFNVFGPRQDPNGVYAAVIPRWVGQMLEGAPCLIYGDGQTSRDFTHVSNVVEANVLAACAGEAAAGRVYNVALGERTTLNGLYRKLRQVLTRREPDLQVGDPIYADFRPGDVRHSQADLGRVRRELGYEPICSVQEGIEQTMAWYVEHARARLK